MKEFFVVVVVYTKNSEIKVLNIEEAKRLQNDLLKDGWVHTQTIDACMYIQYLYNNCNDIDLIDEIKSLATPS